MSKNRQALIYRRNLEQDYQKRKSEEQDRKRRLQVIRKPRVPGLPLHLLSRQKDLISQRRKILDSMSKEKQELIVRYVEENRVLQPPSNTRLGSVILDVRSNLLELNSASGGRDPNSSDNLMLSDLKFARESRAALLFRLSQSVSEDTETNMYKNQWTIDERIEIIPDKNKVRIETDTIVIVKNIALFGGILFVTVIGTTVVLPALANVAGTYALYLGIGQNMATITPFLQYSSSMMFGTSTTISGLDSIISVLTTVQTSYKIYASYKNHGLKSVLKEQLLESGQMALQGVLANVIFGPLRGGGYGIGILGLMQGQLAASVTGNLLAGPMRMYMMQEEISRDEERKRETEQHALMLKESEDRARACLEIASMLKSGKSMKNILEERQKERLEMNTRRYKVTKTLKYIALATSMASTLVGTIYALSQTLEGSKMLVSEIPLISSILDYSISATDYVIFTALSSSFLTGIAISVLSPLINKILDKLHVLELAVQASLWSFWVLKTPFLLRRYYLKKRYGSDYKIVDKNTIIRDLFPETIRKKILQYRFLELLTNMTSEQILRNIISTSFNIATSTVLRSAFQGIQTSLEDMEYEDYLKKRRDFQDTLNGVLTDSLETMPDINSGARDTIFQHWKEHGITFDLKNIFKDPLEKGADAIKDLDSTIHDLNSRLINLYEDTSNILHNLQESGIDAENKDLVSKLTDQLKNISDNLSVATDIRENMSNLQNTIQDGKILPADLMTKLRELQNIITNRASDTESLLENGLQNLNDGQKLLDKHNERNIFSNEIDALNERILSKRSELSLKRDDAHRRFQDLKKQEKFMRGTRQTIADNLTNREYQKQRKNMTKLQNAILEANNRLLDIDSELQSVDTIIGRFNARHIQDLENPNVNIQELRIHADMFEDEINARFGQISSLLEEHSNEIDSLEPILKDYMNAFDKALQIQADKLNKKAEEEKKKIINANKILQSNALKTTLKNKLIVGIDYDKLQKLIDQDQLSPEDYDILEKEFVNPLVEKLAENKPEEAGQFKNCLLNPEDPSCTRTASIEKEAIILGTATVTSIIATGGGSIIPMAAGAAVGAVTARVGWFLAENDMIDEIINEGYINPLSRITGYSIPEVDIADKAQNMIYSDRKYNIADWYIAGLIDAARIAENPSYFNIAYNTVFGEALQMQLFGSTNDKV